MYTGSEIPKVIRYCWFGGKPLPPLALKCIKSWKKLFPGYEIKRWDESNFDVNVIPYTQQAYEAGKYAFVSDYARLWILYNFGGFYFDTDVEVIRNMDDIISSGPFMGCENEFVPCNSPDKLGVNPGLGLCASKGMSFYGELLNLYATLTFKRIDGSLNTETIVSYTTKRLCSKGLKNVPEVQEIEGIKIYPKDYFCPMNYISKQLDITVNTRSIHHYCASWYGKRERLYQFFLKVFGKKIAARLSKLEKKVRASVFCRVKKTL